MTNGATSVDYLENVKITPSQNMKLYIVWEDSIAYTITWKNYDGTVLGTDTVSPGETPVYNGSTPIKANTLKYTYSHSGWSPNIVAANGNAEYTAIFTETINKYTVNIYYKDKDNARQTTEAIATSSQSDVAYGSTITVGRQFMLTTSLSSYVFYMAPVNSFDGALWNSINNNGDLSNDNFIVDVNGNTITLIVLCIQPAAILSTSGSLSLSNNLDYTANKFYTNVIDALKDAKNNTSTNYVRIYGQVKKTTVIENVRLPDDTNTVIASSSVIISGVTYVIDEYEYDFNNYTLQSDYTLDSNDTIILPYSFKDTGSTGLQLEVEDNDSRYYQVSYVKIPSVFIIPKDIVLNVNGKINVGGSLTGTGSIFDQSVLMNNGTINVNANAKITSIGFIKGTGTIELFNGSQLSDVFKMYDYPGGTNSSSLKSKNVFPLQSFSMHNNSCKTIINYGAKYLARALIFVTLVGAQGGEMTMMGSKGLFEITDPNGYIVKSVKDTTRLTNFNTTYASSNQDPTHMEVYEMHGSITDNTISLTLALGQSMSTSKTMALPLGFFEIHFKSGNSIINSNSYKFLPGSRLIIDKKATLTIDSGVQVMFYNEYPDDYVYTQSGNTSRKPYSYATIHSEWYSQKLGSSEFGSKLIINGTLINNGNIAGNILSSENGLLYTANNNTSIKEVTALNYDDSKATVVDKSYNMVGSINGIDNTQFTSGQWYYFNNNTWNNLSEIDIIYETDGGSFSTTPNTIHKFNTDTENLPKPEKTGFSFVGWFLKPNADPDVDPVITILKGREYFSTITLYALWSEATYYNVSFDLNGGNSYIPNSQSIIENGFAKKPTEHPTRTGYKFTGWSHDFSQPITSDIIVTAQWTPITYSVAFNSNGGTGNMDSQTFTYDEAKTLTANSFKMSNKNFNGWNTASDGSGTKYSDKQSVSNLTSVDGATITLYAQWKSTGCFTTGTQILMADGSYKNIENVKVGDNILTWNMFTGKYEAAPVLLYWYHEMEENNVINLEFSDEYVLRIAIDHGLFNVEKNMFIYINEFNYKQFIGDKFIAYCNGTYKEVTLLNAYVTVENTMLYSLKSAFNDNAIANNMFTLTPEPVDGIFRYFTVGENLTYDQELMERDINKFGLSSYEDWKEYISEEVFYALNGQYFNILIGKEIISKEQIIETINNFVYKERIE